MNDFWRNRFWRVQTYRYLHRPEEQNHLDGIEKQAQEVNLTKGLFVNQQMPRQNSEKERKRHEVGSC